MSVEANKFSVLSHFQARRFQEYLTLWEEHGTELSALLKQKAMHLRRQPTKPLASQTPKTLAQTLPQTLEAIQAWVGDCKRCGLCHTRQQIIFGAGNPTARLLFVGEAPDTEEDKEGLPFVGKAGQLLAKIIEAMGKKPTDIYITNVIKCRPPENRGPKSEEISHCFPFLKAQIDAIQPQVIVALGLTASMTLTGLSLTMENLRGKFHPLPWNPGIEILPTHDPAYLLKTPEAKKLVWEDMKLVLKKIDKNL